MEQQAARPPLRARIPPDIRIVLKRLSVWAVTCAFLLPMLSLASPRLAPSGFLSWLNDVSWIVSSGLIVMAVSFEQFPYRRPSGEQQPDGVIVRSSSNRTGILTVLGYIGLAWVLSSLKELLEFLTPSWSLRAGLILLIVGIAGLSLLMSYLGQILRGVRLAEEALDRLNDRQPAMELPAQEFGRLKGVLTRLNTLGARERRFGVLRGQLLRQVDEIAVQEERNRLARDLHDSIKQQLFAINVSAAAVQARWESDPAGARLALADVRRSAHEGMVEMQALLQQLRPTALETVGLVEALREQCEALGYRTGAQVITKFGDLPAEKDLLPGTQEVLFRIAQEALSNIARHARASQVLVKLARQDDALVLEVRDDGQGFDSEHTAAGMGLANMRERAEAFGGSIDLTSRPRAGTVLRVRVPLVPPGDTLRAERLSVEIKEQIESVAQNQKSAVAYLGIGTLLGLMFGVEGVWRQSLEGDVTGRILVSCVFAAAGIILALTYLMRSRRSMTRLSVIGGNETTTIARLRWNFHRGRVHLAFCCAWISGWAWFAGILALPLFGALAVAWMLIMLIEALWAHQAAERYSTLLSIAELRAEIEKTQKDDQKLVHTRYFILSIPVVVLMSFVMVLMTLPLLVRLYEWFFAATDRWYFARWQRRLAQMEASE